MPETTVTPEQKTSALAKLDLSILPASLREAIEKIPESERDPEQLAELLAFYGDQLEETKVGIELKPPTIKVVKEAQRFLMPDGTMVDRVSGIIVFKHSPRRYYRDKKAVKGSQPTCWSFDGTSGNPSPEGVHIGIKPNQPCAKCPLNKWGTATDDKGQATRGKACREFRQLYLAESPKDVPARLRLSPAQIGDFDSFMTARVSQKIADVFMKVNIGLQMANTGGFDFAQATFSNGPVVTPGEMMAFATVRNELKAAAVQAGAGGLDLDDEEDAAGGATAGPPPNAPAGDTPY